jgi:aryl-alcohol dehydrogenase-like predicted oxidoreductase
VALAWTIAQPGVTSLLLGASRLSQLEDNIAALDLRLTPQQTEALSQASAGEPDFFSPQMNRIVFGGVSVEGWRPG